jgi:multicomponent Na+:H+ antiporter subunit D
VIEALHRHLPILQIVIPLLSAPLCLLIRARDRAAAWAIFVCWIAWGCSFWLLWDVLQTGPVQYDIGGWPSPWGIEYRVDLLSAIVLWLVAGMAALVVSFAPESVAREIPPDRQTLFYTLYLLCVTGLLGIVITGDLFNIYVFLEISSLSSYSLISMGRSRRALVASFQYLVMGTIGATFILIGIGLCFQMTGTLNLRDLARLMTELTNGTPHRSILVAFAFLSIGLSVKMAIFPVHQWLPNTYTYAPSVVSAFLAATSTKVTLYVFMRVTYTLFKPSFVFDYLPFGRGLIALALVGIYLASFSAIFQRDLKRLLAFSSIGQIGYIVLGIATATSTGVSAGILHLVNHGLTKGGLFLAVGCLAARVPLLQMDDIRGLGRRMPWTGFAFILGGLGLIGIPLTAGFVSKWYLMVALFELGYGLEALLVLGSSLVAVLYVGRMVEVLYFGEPQGAGQQASEAPLSLLIPTYIVLGATLLFGVWSFPTQVAHEAAMALLGAP